MKKTEFPVLKANTIHYELKEPGQRTVPHRQTIVFTKPNAEVSVPHEDAWMFYPFRMNTVPIFQYPRHPSDLALLRSNPAAR